jgi:group I intron endonuclease
MADSGIYEIVNLRNGKRYVGSAVHIKQRWREHRKGLRRGDHANIHLRRAWAKDGEADFAFRVIELCEPERLIEREQAHMDAGCDYNICPTAGSTLGRLHSEETRRKIAAKAVGRTFDRSDEYRQAVSERWKGKAKSPEHMAALQAGRRRQVRTPEQLAAVGESLKRAYAEGRKSRERSPEYRAKIAATLRRQAQSPEMRERLREQARAAWAKKTPEERAAHMEKVRAAKHR